MKRILLASLLFLSACAAQPNSGNPAETPLPEWALTPPDALSVSVCLPMTGDLKQAREALLKELAPKLGTALLQASQKADQSLRENLTKLDGVDPTSNKALEATYRKGYKAIIAKARLAKLELVQAKGEPKLCALLSVDAAEGFLGDLLDPAGVTLPDWAQPQMRADLLSGEVNPWIKPEPKQEKASPQPPQGQEGLPAEQGGAKQANADTPEAAPAESPQSKTP